MSLKRSSVASDRSAANSVDPAPRNDGRQCRLRASQHQGAPQRGSIGTAGCAGGASVYGRSDAAAEVASWPHGARSASRPDRDSCFMADERILLIRHLRRSFDHREVIGGLDLQLEPSQCVALWGFNGSGKTTILRCISGTRPDGRNGQIRRPRAGSLVLGRLSASFSQERSFYLSAHGRRTSSSSPRCGASRSWAERQILRSSRTRARGDPRNGSPLFDRHDPAARVRARPHRQARGTSWSSMSRRARSTKPHQTLWDALDGGAAAVLIITHRREDYRAL